MGVCGCVCVRVRACVVCDCPPAGKSLVKTFANFTPSANVFSVKR